MTGVTDHGKPIALTASLNPSFSDMGSQESVPMKPAAKQETIAAQSEKTPLQK
jgi:hypothetical protein